MSPSYSLFPLSNENYFCKRDLSSILIIQVARSKLFLGTLILWNKLNLFLFPFRATTATAQLCTVTRPRSRITFHSNSTFYNHNKWNNVQWICVKRHFFGFRQVETGRMVQIYLTNYITSRGLSSGYSSSVLGFVNLTNVFDIVSSVPNRNYLFQK